MRPIGPPEFAALMERLGPHDPAGRVAVAVSGGADSSALALLLARWGRPEAAIVDHGLRPGSAAEASLAARRLAAIGVPATILRADLTPGPAQAERARIARYALLRRFCRERGLPDLCLAHHDADQAETVQLRQGAGSGTAGLAAMPLIGYTTEARLLRPLLGISPDRLRATLRDAGLPWVEDPSNTDPGSPRARLRASMTEAGRAAALALAGAAAGLRAALEAETARELAAVHIAPEGYAIVPGPISQAALSALVWTLSGRRHPPPRAMLAAGLQSRTLHGVVLRPAGRLGPGTLVAREPAAVAAAVPAVEGALWDGRFRLAVRVAAGLTLGALGPPTREQRRLSPLPALVLATLPALRRDGVLEAVPHLQAGGPPIRFTPQRPAAPCPGVAFRPEADARSGPTPHFSSRR